MDRDKIQKIKMFIAIFVVLIIAILVIFNIIKYQEEGEKNMPFKLSKIIVVSTAQKDDNQSTDETENNGIWNFKIIQNNDMYISIEKNTEKPNNKSELKNVTISDIEILENSTVGNIFAYMPSSEDTAKYKYTNDYIVSQSLTFRGADETNLKNLQVCRNGGNIELSLANTGIGTYSSGEDTAITYNGTMLSKLGISNENVKFKLAFNLIIELNEGKKYSGRVELNIPCDGLTENGISQIEITDFSNVVFKRI